MHTIHLKAVDSRYATNEELVAAGITLDQIPASWQGKMMAHQATTIRALRDGDAAIVVNEARTGDGKTFAGQFPLFADGWRTLTMYPTNELAKDQRRSLNELLGKWTPPRWANVRLFYELLNAETLDELQESRPGLLRPKAVQMLLDNELTLTNPDIFHLITELGYSHYGAAQDIILGYLAHHYRLFVFDEFHQFGSAQSASILIALLLMREITRGKQTPRFLFLSATPQQLLGNLASKVGLKVLRIGGDYEHGMPSVRGGRRRILQTVSLNLYSQRLDEWVKEHFEDVILRFYKDHAPAAKGVIIANSVAAAHRIHDMLREPCDKAHIDLDINTGVIPPPERRIDADLLVATSTVDVGVDFKINLLIFDSMDASSHIQRLGRLGRHTHGYDEREFADFEAHALLPSWVVDDLTKAFPTGNDVCRPNYEEKLREVFSPFQQFEAYVDKWGGVQAAHVINTLGSPEIRTQYEPFSKQLSEQFKKIFPHGAKQYRRLNADKQFHVLDEALSFRGGSPFNALLLDLSRHSQTIVPYDLITLLKYGELENAEIEDFYEQTRRKGNTTRKLERTNPLVAFKLHRWLEQPRTVNIYIDQQLGEEYFTGVWEINRVNLAVLDGPDLLRLNRRLEERQLVARLIHGRPDDWRRPLRLGYQLEIFDFTSVGKESGSIVFARDALLIDSILWHKRSRSDDAIIC